MNVNIMPQVVGVYQCICILCRRLLTDLWKPKSFAQKKFEHNDDQTHIKVQKRAHVMSKEIKFSFTLFLN